MLQIEDSTFEAMRRAHDHQQAGPVAHALREACPERFVGMDFAVGRAYAENWLNYVRQFGLDRLNGIVRLFVLWDRWGGFDDDGSAWIVEILRGPLDESEKIASLYELLY